MTDTLQLRLGTTPKRLDAAAVQQGVARECPFRDGLVVTILPAAMFNPRFRKALQNRIERKVAENGDGSMPGDEHVSRHRDPVFVASALVADMTITNAAGEVVEYTPELGAQLLADPGHADVLEWIGMQAYEIGDFYETQVKEEEKNS